jgi:hypothetical protein
LGSDLLLSGDNTPFFRLVKNNFSNLKSIFLEKLKAKIKQTDLSSSDENLRPGSQIILAQLINNSSYRYDE